MHGLGKGGYEKFIQAKTKRKQGQQGVSKQATLEEKNLDNRENGQVFEMKVAMKLGRSVSELRRLASKSASCRMEGIAVDEFSSKLF